MVVLLISAALGLAPAPVKSIAPFVELCSIDATPAQRDICIVKMLRAARRRQ